jgi:hypothetical protein
MNKEGLDMKGIDNYEKKSGVAGVSGCLPISVIFMQQLNPATRERNLHWICLSISAKSLSERMPQRWAELSNRIYGRIGENTPQIRGMRLRVSSIWA